MSQFSDITCYSLSASRSYAAFFWITPCPGTREVSSVLLSALEDSSVRPEFRPPSAIPRSACEASARTPEERSAWRSCYAVGRFA